jgi:hypothetical protein
LPADTAVVPLGFTPQSQGCQKAAFPSTFSDNSIEWLIPHEAPIACTEKNPAVPDNTATSTSLILPALQGGNVVFLDDPQAADVQAALAKVHYTVVPLVSSAVVMGYVAAMQQDGQKYPFNSVRLTPNEVAGLTTYLYQGPFNGDMVSCPGGTCSAIEDLNSVPGFVGASEYGSFIPSEATGVTEELTDWICHAPNVPFVLNGKLITDPNTAQTTFTTSNGQTPWPITKCTTFDQFPPLKPLGSLFAPAADAPHQVKFLRTFAIPPQFQPSPVIGFTPIDWDDARYNGLDSASLQNADGQFVAPSTASVQAEVSAEPISKAGYPLPTPALKVNGGYPMSTVIDALVPDSSLPAVQSKPIADMMNELLQYTTTTANLPDGFVPLPAKLAAIAHTNLAKAIAAENVPAPTATTTTPTVSPDSATEGTSVAYSATVTAASGTPAGGVTFAAGSTALCTAKLAAGKGSCTASDAPIGSDIVTASYAGGGGFAASSATTTIEVVSSGSQTTVPPTTIGGGDGTTGVATSPTTTVATSVPSTTVPTRTSTKKKTGGGGNLSVADVTLASGAARIALPVALAVGGILIALSLGLSFVGVLRRRHAAGTDGG